jgi:hypothetical protein
MLNSESSRSDTEYSDMSESNSYSSDLDKYNGKDYRSKDSEKFVYSGCCLVCIGDEPKYINIEKCNISEEYRNVELEVPFKGEIYNLYIDIERAKYGEDIIVCIMKNGKMTNLLINTKDKQSLINYNIMDCILCESSDKIALSVMGKQKRERIIKWAISYKKIN